MLSHPRDQIKNWVHAPYYEAAEGWPGMFWDAGSGVRPRARFYRLRRPPRALRGVLPAAPPA